MRRLEWSEADRVEVRFRGHKGHQAQVGSVVVRTRSEVRGPRSELGKGGGAVAVMVALLSCHAALPEHAPLSSGKHVRVWGYGQALRALRGGREIGAKPQRLRPPLVEDRKRFDARGRRRRFRTSHTARRKVEVR